MSNNIFSDEKSCKHVTGYLYDGYKIKPPCMMRTQKVRSYVKSCENQTKWMYFLIEGDDLLKKYNKIWDKVSADIKKNLIMNMPIVKRF